MMERESAILALGPIVRSAARRIAAKTVKYRRSAGVDDLTQVGWMAATRVVDNFDPSRGVRLDVYARAVIEGAIANAVRSDDPVSERDRRTLRQRATYWNEFTAGEGRAPTLAELERSVPGSSIALRYAYIASYFPLDEPRQFDEWTASWHDVIPGTAVSPEDALLAADLRQTIADAVNSLPIRLAAVVRDAYFAKQPLWKIAVSMGVSHQRVSQMHLRALELLRSSLGAA